MNNEFINYVNNLKEQVLHVDTLEPDLTLEGSALVLDSIKRLAACVASMIELSFPTKQMSNEELEAVLQLERLLLRLRGQETIRLEALKKFEAMTAGAVNQ